MLALKCVDAPGKMPGFFPFDFAQGRLLRSELVTFLWRGGKFLACTGEILGFFAALRMTDQ